MLKHPMTDRVKPSFVIFDVRALWRSVPRCHHWYDTRTLYRYVI